MFRKLNGATDERLPHDLPGWNRRSLFYFNLYSIVVYVFLLVSRRDYPVSNQDRIDRLEQDQPL